MPKTRAKEIEMQITADNAQRVGVYSNSFFVRTNEDAAIIDFCFIDDIAGSEEQAVANGVLATRVIMTTEGLIRLRDAIDSHFKNNRIAMPLKDED